MAFEVKLIFLEPRDVEFLAGSAALELTIDILLIVSYDPNRERSTLRHSGPLRKLSLTL